MKKINLRDTVNSPALPIVLLMLTLIILALVAVSPVALKQVARIPGMDWTVLSNVGQTYGAISALLSALALGGVVASLLYQARDVRTASEQAARTFHFELLKMEMNDPFYMEIMAPTGVPGADRGDYDSLRKRHFIHMWVSYWEGRYKLHEMSDSEIRYLAASVLFRSSEGRRYWTGARDVKLATYSGRLSRFAKIVDDEYGKAIAAGAPSVISLSRNLGDGLQSSLRKKPDMRAIVCGCAGAGTVVILGRLMWRRFSSGLS